MRLSDLLHSDVVDVTGNTIGSVDDVRLVQDGPVLANFGAALRLDGLVVGAGAVGLRLGFHRAGVQGPWLLRRLFTRLERRARFVPWDAVEAIEPACIRLRLAADELPRLTDR